MLVSLVCGAVLAIACVLGACLLTANAADTIRVYQVGNATEREMHQDMRWATLMWGLSGLLVGVWLVLLVLVLLR